MRGSFVLAKPRNPLRCLAGYEVGLSRAWMAWWAEYRAHSYLPKPAIRCAAWRATGSVCRPLGRPGGPNAGIIRTCQTPQSAALLGGLRGWFVARLDGLAGRMRDHSCVPNPAIRCAAWRATGSVCRPLGRPGGPNTELIRACQAPQSAALLGGLRGRFVARLDGLVGRIPSSIVLAKTRNPLRCLAGYGVGL